MNLEVVGHRVLIKPEVLEEVTKGGIYIGGTDTYRREQGATQIGIIVGVGPNAWLDFKSAENGEAVIGKPWAKIGDKVYYAKYAGKDIETGNEETYVMINDEDVQCIIKEDEES